MQGAAEAEADVEAEAEAGAGAEAEAEAEVEAGAKFERAPTRRGPRLLHEPRRPDGGSTHEVRR